VYGFTFQESYNRLYALLDRLRDLNNVRDLIK
jgi:hypothetical protein